MPRIDSHCHVFPPAYRDQVGRAGGSKPQYPVPPPPTHADLLAHMDDWELDGAILSAGGPLRGEHDAPTLARMFNEGYAELVRDNPSRFAALAALPLPDLDAAMSELEYALDELALDGVLLLTNHQGVYLGDPSLDAFFDELNRRGAYCFVHPDFPPSAPLPLPGRWCEFPFDTTRALLNMALSGTFDRCPNVRMQWAHLGGTIPFIADRIDLQSGRMPDSTSGMDLPMRDYVARQYYDTGLSYSHGNLISAMHITQIEHIVFGTDWPHGPIREGQHDLQPELEIFGRERGKLDFENAAALVPRLAAEIAPASSSDAA